MNNLIFFGICVSSLISIVLTCFGIWWGWSWFIGISLGSLLINYPWKFEKIKRLIESDVRSGFPIGSYLYSLFF